MPKDNVADIYRLSPVQQGILFHTLSAPESGVYFEQFNLSYGEGFDPDAFCETWQRTVDRHPVLRTSFLWENLEEPVQVVQRRVEVPAERRDWREMPADDRRARVDAYLAEDRRLGFDLTRAPLLRLALLRLTDDDTHVVWSYHHLLLDGWSAGLIMRETFATYGALLRGEEPRLEERRPFRDYVAWLRRHGAEGTEEYWRRTLAAFTEPTPLGLDRTPGGEAGDDPGYATLLDRLSEGQTAELRDFAKAHRLTLNTIVQGAWAILLSRLAGREDVLFGTTVAGRPPSLSGVDSMIGCFINTLPVRARVPAREELLPWLRGFQAKVLELRKHEHTALLDVRAWSQVPRHLPLFESLLVFESFTADAYFEMSNTGVFQRTNYPLTLIATSERQLLLRVGYELSRFSTAAVRRLVGSLKRLLRAMPESTGRRLGELAVLTPEDAHRLREWNDTAAARPAESAPELLARRAAAVPEAVALVHGRAHLSYRALTSRAGTLARRLRRRGVGPEERVGLCLERSPEMVTAVLAVLGAGGAYVPLDPGHPEERLAFVVEDAAPGALLVQERHRALAGRLAAAAGRKPAVVVVDDEGPAAGEGATEESPLLEAPLDPGNLAYLIYTSGSTGRPKGVAVAHGALANFLAALGERPGLDAGDRLLAVTTLSFDISALEILLPLTVGARVVLAGRDEQADPDALAALAERSRVTFMQATPATWRMLLGVQGWGGEGLSILSGGEALSRELADRLLGRAGAVWNGYGPTEDTVYATLERVEDGPDPVTVGRPGAGPRAAILDRRGLAAPPGTPGELSLAGAGLARGYFRRPALTAERFVPDAIGLVGPGERLYRTGDLARFTPAGEVEFLGRIDHQVKVRGFRIEPGEVEAALVRHAGVRGAVVTARKEASGEMGLLAYVVPPEGGEAPPVGELRAALGRELPGYMVPGAFVPLDALPLTPNGKVDRSALPEPGRERPGLEEGPVPPRDDLELRLVGIWEAVLGRSPVGVTDGFFELGGHSLSAVSLAGRIRRQLGRRVAPAALLEAGTVERLATELRRSGEPAGRGPLVRIQPRGEAPPFFCVHPIGGNVFCYAELARRLGDEAPFYGLQTPDDDGRGRSPADLGELAERHLEAVREVQSQGPYHLGGWSMGGVVAVEMARRLQQSEEEVALVALLDSRPPGAAGLPEDPDDAVLLSFFARDLAGIAGRELRVEAGELQASGDPLAAFLEQARQAGLLPPDLDSGQARAFFNLFRNNLRAVTGSRMRPYPGRLTLFRARKGLPEDGDPDLGWEPWAGEGVDVHPVPGDHYSMLRPPHLEELAAALGASLQAARTGASARARHAVGT